GGIFRDVLINRKPIAFQSGPLYGSAALIGSIIYCLMREYSIFPNIAGGFCAFVILVIRYASLIFGWQTAPPRDYTDTVVHAVGRPVKFIARKAHIPIGKVARDKQKKQAPKTRARVIAGRIYRRLSGEWMNDRQEASTAEATGTISPQSTGPIKQTAPSKADQPPKQKYRSSYLGSTMEFSPEADCTHWTSPPPEADVSDGAAAYAEAAGVTPPPADLSDRIFVDRKELHKVLDELKKKADTGEIPVIDEASFDPFEPLDYYTAREPLGPIDPFEPQTPDPKKNNNPRNNRPS
ncbi:MAG: TRIC cation channel family protein, partial [Eggerthellaceae bacterium]|nr:TRIC cation channel family protein [Eggerthellaceae bacterium]